MTGHCTLRKHPHTMGIFKNDLLCKLLNEVGEATSHIIFNCKTFTRRRYTNLGYYDLKEILPKENLTKLLLYLATENKLFALELMQPGKCSKTLSFSVTDYKYRLTLRFNDHDHHNHHQIFRSWIADTFVDTWFCTLTQNFSLHIVIYSVSLRFLCCTYRTYFCNQYIDQQMHSSSSVGATTLGGFWPALRFRSTIFTLLSPVSHFHLL